MEQRNIGHRTHSSFAGKIQGVQTRFVSENLREIRILKFFPVKKIRQIEVRSALLS